MVEIERVERTRDGREKREMFEGGFYCCRQGLERVCFRYRGGLARLKKKDKHLHEYKYELLIHDRETFSNR